MKYDLDSFKFARKKTAALKVDIVFSSNVFSEIRAMIYKKIIEILEEKGFKKTHIRSSFDQLYLVYKDEEGIMLKKNNMVRIMETIKKECPIDCIEEFKINDFLKN